MKQPENYESITVLSTRRNTGKDVAAIADTARSMPHPLCPLEPTNKLTAELLRLNS